MGLSCFATCCHPSTYLKGQVQRGSKDEDLASLIPCTLNYMQTLDQERNFAKETRVLAVGHSVRGGATMLDIRLGLYSEIAYAMLSHSQRYSGGIRRGQSDPWQGVNTSDLAISLPSRDYLVC